MQPYSLPEHELPEMPDWIEALNQRLSAAGAVGAERAFSLGCSSSLVPTLIVLGIAFLLGVRHWLSLLLTLLICALLATAWTAFLATQVNRGAARRLYQDELHAEIAAGLSARGMDWDNFSQQVETTLPENAHLRNCLKQASLDVK